MKKIFLSLLMMFATQQGFAQMPMLGGDDMPIVPELSVRNLTAVEVIATNGLNTFQYRLITKMDSNCMAFLENPVISAYAYGDSTVVLNQSGACLVGDTGEKIKKVTVVSEWQTLTLPGSKALLITNQGSRIEVRK